MHASWNCRGPARVRHKIKTPVVHQAMYGSHTTSSSMEVTPQYQRRPFEVFIIQELDALSCRGGGVCPADPCHSAVFRKGGDTTFLVYESQGGFDPRRYWPPGAIHALRPIAELGYVIDRALTVDSACARAQLDVHS